MYALTMTPEHRSGQPSIDKDHAELFDICNQLFATQKQLGAQDEVAKLLAALVQHLEEHFAKEEESQNQVKYPHAEAHKKEHQKLLTLARDLIHRQSLGVLSFGDLYKALAMDIIKGHLEGPDGQFHIFLKKAAEQTTPQP